MATTATETIVRESPEIEAYRLGLLQLAKARGSKPVDVPDKQVAGLTADQQQAMASARGGIGSYQPYMDQAQNYMGQAGQGFAGVPGQALNFAGTAMAQNDMYTQHGIGMGQQAGSAAVNQGAGLATLANQYAGQGQNQIVNPAAQAAGIGTMAGFQGAQNYNPNSAQNFMIPYTQNVIDASMNEIEHQADFARQNTAGNAVSAGAFGGGRDAVMRAELERGIIGQKANTIANLNNQNYAQAQQAAMNDQQNTSARMQNAGNMAFQGGQLQSNAGLASLGLGANTAAQTASTLGNQGLTYANMLQSGGLQAGQQMANTTLQGGQLASSAQLDSARGIAGLAQNSATMGGLQQAYGQADNSFLYNMGANQQKQGQAQLDANYSNQMAQAYEPFQRIGFMNDIYSKVPTSQQTLNTSTTPDASAASQIIGAGIAGYGALNAFNKANTAFGS
jgi:hypothetical protein